MKDKARFKKRGLMIIFALIYGMLLIASHLVQSKDSIERESAQAEIDTPYILIDPIRKDGTIVPDRVVRMYFNQWPPNDLPTQRTPVLLMHGSPGSGDAFSELAPIIAKTNRLVLAPDLPGYGKSDLAPDMSYKAQARAASELLDEVRVDRVHVVGWSSSGGVAIQMAEKFPDRVASITMLAAIGAQETEGSGSYAFEHFKYAVGYLGLGYGPELIPHFGKLDTFEGRVGWLKAFWDSDQRDLSRIMPTITTPTLILHGRDDPLVAASGAEVHHEMMPTSKLIMLDASHFLPFMQAQETARYLNEFFARHDEPGIQPLTGYENHAPAPQRHGMDALLHATGGLVKVLPVIIQILLIVVLVRLYPIMGTLLAMVFVGMMSLDLAAAVLGIIIGRGLWMARGIDQLNRPWTTLRWIRTASFVIPLCIFAGILGTQVIGLASRLGTIGFILGMGLGWCILNGLRLVVTWEGRQRFIGWLRRAIYHEYWPRFLVYLPVLWWGFKRMIHRKGLQPLTAVNPGYAYDGGVQDESKSDLNIKLGDGDPPAESVLHCVLIDEVSMEARYQSARAAIERDDELGGYPMIAKPNKGERGRAVKLLRNDDDLEIYCTTSNEPFILQKYHPGPVEVGVLWMRHTKSIIDPSYEGPTGFIYAITIKHFPTLRGDAKRTLRRLILAHPRHRAQPAVFFEHNRSRLGWVPMDGEKVVLGIAGNHAQGAKFTDGADFITPALTERMNSIIDRFDQRAGRGFDIGRFDLRCESLDQLSKGAGFGIVELNGLTSEPTNLYDPKRSLFWAWDMLLGYWKHLERLAEARIETKTGEPVDDRTWDRIRNALVRAMF